MSDFYPSQVSFLGGYLSRLIRGRVDVKDYAIGLSECRNFDITPEGALANRGGFRYIDQAASQQARIFAFPRGDFSDIAVVVDGTSLSLLTPDGALSSSVSNILQNALFYDGFSYWEKSTGGGAGSNLKSFANAGTGYNVRTVSIGLNGWWIQHAQQVTVEAAEYAAAVLLDTPLGFWELGETSGTLVDSGSGGNDGTAVGSPTYRAGNLVGEIGASSLAFNATSSVDIGAPAALQLTASFTLEAVIKPTATDITNGAAIIAYADGGYALGIDVGGKVILYHSNNVEQVLSTSTLTAGTTYHIAAKVGAADQWAILIDGEVDNSGTTALNLGVPVGNLTIGEDPSDPWPFDGQVSMVAVFNSELADADILSHYEAMKPGADELTFSYKVVNGSKKNPFSMKTILRIGTTEGAADIDSDTNTQSSSTFSKDNVSHTFTATQATFWVTLRTELTAAALEFRAYYSKLVLKSEYQPAIAFASGWDETQLPDLHVAADSSSQQMFFFHPNVQPKVLTYDTNNDLWSLSNYAPTGMPGVWADGEYPGTGCVHQSRLWTSAHPSKKGRIWASKSGDFGDMSTGTNPDDGLDFALATDAAVMWLNGHEDLLIGTDRGMWVGTSSAGIITPDDFFFKQQTGYAAGNRQPAFVGDQIAYVSYGGTRIRAINQSNDIRAWTSSDLTYKSAELIEDGVTRLGYALDPGYQLFAVTTAGDLVVITYDMQARLNAAYLYETAGQFYDIAVTNAQGGSALWAITMRDDIPYIEHCLLGRARDFVMDSYIVRPIEAANEVTGLDHLEGLEVACTIDPDTDDPAYAGTYTVSGGSITIGAAFSGAEAVVGRAFEMQAATLPLDGGNPAGTAQGSKRRWARIFAKLVNSAIPLLNGRTPATPAGATVPSSANERDTITSEDVEARALGYDKGIATITQDVPIRTTVVSLFGKATEKHT